MIPEPRTASGCHACVTARCCVRFDPELTGADLRRLAAGLDLAPADFARLGPADARQAGPDGVRLDGGPSAWLLRLSSADRRIGGDEAARPCVFLISLARDLHRCGAYAHRPLRCRTFPAELTPMGVMVSTPEAICPPGAWSVARADLVTTRQVHLRARVERAAYRAWLRDWNARAAAAPADSAAFLAALLSEQAPIDAALAPHLRDPARAEALATAWFGPDLDGEPLLALADVLDPWGRRAHGSDTGTPKPVEQAV